VSVALGTLARLADEVEVFSVSVRLLDTQTFTVLPDVASLTSHAVRAIIHLPIDTTHTVKDPVVLLLVDLFQGALILLNFGF
jgi:formate-dependent phosphoribosylglycinamide formyltransferase (GAR transformylase)